MTILITFNVANNSDLWLRQMTRGMAPPSMPVQRVIVGDFDEAERLVREMARLKYQRGKPYGGSERYRIDR